MRNTAISVNEDYALGTASVAFGTSGLGTISQSDYKGLRRAEITYNGSDYFLGAKMPINSFLPNQVFNSTQPYFYMQGENIIGVKPEQNGGTVKMIYNQLMTPLVNDTDELPLSMRGYTLSFTNYCYAQALYKENKTTEGKNKEDLSLGDLERFKMELSPRNKTGPTYIKFVEPVSAEEYWI